MDQIDFNTLTETNIINIAKNMKTKKEFETMFNHLKNEFMSITISIGNIEQKRNHIINLMQTICKEKNNHVKTINTSEIHGNISDDVDEIPEIDLHIEITI